MLTDVQLEREGIRPHISGAPISKDPSQGSVETMAYLSETAKVQGWLSRLASFLPTIERKRHVLDVRTLSDHLKRDMGFLDGAPTSKRR